jgi:hydroxymethylglutaryl-CoA reductase (NADPH)
VAPLRPSTPANATPGIQQSASALDYALMTDADVMNAVSNKKLAMHALETATGDHARAVRLRRQLMVNQHPKLAGMEALPLDNYDYEVVHGKCCESVVGHLTIPVGLVGPLTLDGEVFHVPFATTEGALVASTSRGCKAITAAGGAESVLLRDGMTRAPLVRFPTVKAAAEVRSYCADPANFESIAKAFNSTSRFARLQSIKPVLAGRDVHLRMVCNSGDAMGMNMVSKGCQEVLGLLHGKFDTMKVLALSGNLCTDKKPSAINWLEGRGKSVAVEVMIPEAVVRTVLHTTAKELEHCNVHKNLIGSALAGSIGGNNAHASNIVTGIFMATGQDPAQNVESSNCMTLMEAEENGDLHMSVTMPTIEVGTVGGGTVLPAQRACLDMMGLAGSNAEEPGKNAQTLARIVAATVMAGELSLMSALVTNDLMSAHLKLNRAKPSPDASA